MLQALPLCGAALTFFAAAKKVSKESGLTPPMLDDFPRALNVPTLHTARKQSTFIANVLPIASPASHTFTMACDIDYPAPLAANSV